MVAFYSGLNVLLHWGRVMHICVSTLTIIGSDNGLSPDRWQTIIWTYAGMLLIRPLETNFSEILIKIYTFSFKKVHLKISCARWRPFWSGLNVLMYLQCFPMKCYAIKQRRIYQVCNVWCDCLWTTGTEIQLSILDICIEGHPSLE